MAHVTQTLNLGHTKLISCSTDAADKLFCKRSYKFDVRWTFFNSNL